MKYKFHLINLFLYFYNVEYIDIFSTEELTNALGKTNVKVIGIEPDTSPLITKGYAGVHGLQGIGANFIPDVLDQNVIDEVLTESLDSALESMKAIGKLEGVFIGISGGAALHAAIEQGKKEENRGKNIVVVLPDGGDRYLSNLD